LSGNKTHLLCHINFSEIRAFYEIITTNVIDTEAYKIFHDLNTIGRHIDAVCMPNNDEKIHTYRLIWGQKYENREVSLRNSSYYDLCILIVRTCAVGHGIVKGFLFCCFIAVL
jgi:hypothetical protein